MSNLNKNILFVPGLAGLDLQYVLPKIATHGLIITYIAKPLSSERIKVINDLSSVIIYGKYYEQSGISENELAEDLAINARKHNVDAIFTLDEFYIHPVSLAAEMVGLLGAGKNVLLSRNKFKMRERFAENGVPSVKFVHVRNVDDIHTACRELEFPFLLKATESAGGLGQIVINSKEHAVAEYDKLYALIKNMGENKNLSLVDTFTNPEFIAENIIKSTNSGWFDSDLYGDHLSVEGMVIDGQYHPICITSRTPNIKPFIEFGLQVPAVISHELRDKLVHIAKLAVDSLGLEYCGTHTEIKLMTNNEACIIETAARFGGLSIVRMIEDVFNVDMIDILLTVLLTRKIPQSVPKYLLTSDNAKISTGVIVLFPSTFDGVPWQKPAIIKHDLNLQTLLEGGVSYELTWAKSLKDGEQIPKFDPSLGYINGIASVYMRSDTPDKIIKSTHTIFNNLEQLLSTS